MINAMTKRNLGSKGLISSYHSRSQSTTEGKKYRSWSRNRSRNHGVQVSGSLTDHFLTAFLYSPGPPTEGIVLLTLGPTLSQSMQQIMIKKFPSDIGHRTIWSGHFFFIEAPSSQVTPVWFKLKIKTTQHAWFMTSSIGLLIATKMRCPHAYPKY